MKKEAGHITITLFLDDKTNKEDWKIENDRGLPVELVAKILKDLSEVLYKQDSKHFSTEIQRV